MKRIIIISVLLVATCFNVSAYDFSRVSDSGDIICFRINPGNSGVTVTYMNRPYGSGAAYSNISGNIILPAAVEYSGIIYKVTAIGDSAFRNCTGITTVAIPETVKSIGVDAFRGCSGLTSMIITDSVESIGVAAFQYCSSLAELTLGRSVRYVGNYAAEGLSSLTWLNFTGDVSDWCGITFGNWANPMAFSHNLHFNYDTIPLRNLVIPEGIESINYNAFEWDTCLHSVSFPSSLASIGGQAFRNCLNLHEVIFRSTTPPSIGSSAFWNESRNYRTFYVPCPYYQNYVYSWGNSYAIDCYNLLNITIRSNDTVRGTCGHIILSDSTAEITAYANYGYHFTEWNDGDTNNPRTITLTQDTSFTAMFAQNQYLLVISCTDTALGSVGGSGTYGYLDTVEISATASEHYHFVRWDDGNTLNPRTIVITSDTSRSAIFAIDTHSVTLHAENITHGMCIGNSQYQYGTAATVEALPYSGYRFSHWSDGSTFNPYSFAVVDNVYLTAYFYADGTPYQDTIFIHDTIYVDMPTHDTLWLHDTVFVYDTIYVGVDDVETINAKIYTSNGQIVVDGTQGKTVWLYDVNGRVLATKQDEYSPLYFDVPALGAYLIKIGSHPARKVVVVR